MAKAIKNNGNNCRVMSETSDENVTKQSPWTLKKRELQGETLDMEGRIKAPNANQGLDEARQTWTRKQRNAQPGKGSSVKAL